MPSLFKESIKAV
ncbi:uncharacterized protein FFM5_15352 [Fusarium fujikuroi]|nr:uncharacterized protein FFM5_15352 [Fusarium fujikuroi]